MRKRAIIVGLLVGVLVLLVLLASVTTPGAALGCTADPPPGWQHLPACIKQALEIYCGS